MVEKYILEGIVSDFGNCPTYPGLIYGKYNCVNGKWVLDLKWCEDNKELLSEIELKLYNKLRKKS